jgi:aspartate/methionine/tyrosine aminotransferase
MIENLVDTIRDGPNNHYTTLQGHPLLRQQIAKHFSPILNNRPLDPNTNILVTNGALGSIFSICMNFAGPDDEILMFEPYFTIYANNIDFSGAKAVTAPMTVDSDGHWHFDFKAFEAAITPKTKLVMITNPHNPTGKVFTSDDFQQLSEILDRNPSIKVLSDEVYFHLTFDGR